MVFGLMIVVLGCSFFVAFLRARQCARCHIPLQPVAEGTRAWGTHVVETVVYYECADCSRVLERKFLHTHVT
jgi:hypothetical protein